VQNSTTVVSKHEEGIQDLVAHSWYDEEIDRDHVVDVIAEKRLPCGRGRLAAAYHVFLDGRFGDNDTDPTQLTKDAR
jgi:hypothetical protein